MTFFVIFFQTVIGKKGFLSFYQLFKSNLDAENVLVTGAVKTQTTTPADFF